MVEHASADKREEATGHSIGHKRRHAAGENAETSVPSVTPVLADPVDIFVPGLLSDTSRAVLGAQYKHAEPYTHCVISALCKPELLAAVRDEIIENIQATYKETDLFKVFQTGDLGNLDKLDKEAVSKVPTLMALKAALYSTEFRAFVREVTGCGELADKTDCSCNVYAKGGHLLCHDDVIGTRRVSWIIYLTDPDEPWTFEDGGALELYPLEQGKPHTPAVHPTVFHLPTFNSMAMFTVLPGKSFHAVQEVVTGDKPRMSISGWYHAPHEPEDMRHASLQQLQQPAADGGLKAGQDNVSADQYTPFKEVDGSPLVLTPNAAPVSSLLSDEDMAFLIRYVNPVYLSDSAWPRIQARFEETGSVQLQGFLARGLAERIRVATRAADACEQLGNNALPPYEAGVTGGWRAVGPPHKQRYLAYHPNGDNVAAGEVTVKCKAAGDLLEQVRGTLFTHPAFQRLLRAFTTLNMVGYQGEVRRFRPGLDYTVAHYGIVTKDPRLDVVLCFVDLEGPPPSQPASESGQQGEGQASSEEQPGAQGGPQGAGEEEGEEEGEEGGKEETAGDGKAPAAKRRRKFLRKKAGSGPQLPPRQPDMSVWDDGEVGGFEAYLLADEDKEGSAAAAEVYRPDAEDTGVLNVSAGFNNLNLVLRDEGLMRFVKYVSAAAPGSRWDVRCEYLPEDDSDSEEEGA